MMPPPARKSDALQSSRSRRHWPVWYDPDRGLTDIATAEVGERYFERAKDAARLFEAIEIKITRQAEYVVWRDAQPKNKGGRGHKTDCSSATGLPDADR